MDPNQLWFNTPDTATLCRGGGNGSQHPSQLYAIKRYVNFEMTFLDYGCGSATTLEALLNYWDKVAGDWKLFDASKLLAKNYKGVDIIPKNIEWCKEQWPYIDFEVNPSIHKIDQPDKSWDVVYSRHVVDHMKSFEDAMDEHCRVAKKLVIVVLWYSFAKGDEHEIKNIDYRPSGGELYPDEYTNSYSKKLCMDYLENKEGWEILEVAENVGAEVSGRDVVIVLKRI